MTCCRIDRRLISPRLHQEFNQSLGTALHVWLMLLQRTHRRNPKNGKQFLKEPFLVSFNVLLHIFMLFLYLTDCLTRQTSYKYNNYKS